MICHARTLQYILVHFAVSLAHWVDERRKVYEARQRRVEAICLKHNVSSVSSNDTMEDLINFSVHNDSATGNPWAKKQKNMATRVGKFKVFCRQVRASESSARFWSNSKICHSRSFLLSVYRTTVALWSFWVQNDSSIAYTLTARPRPNSTIAMVSIDLATVSHQMMTHLNPICLNLSAENLGKIIY